MKTRSKFETAVMQSNPRILATMYEARRLPVLLPTTYLPDVITPGGLIVELKGRHPQLMTALEKPKLVAKELNRYHTLTQKAKSKDSSHHPWSKHYVGIALLTMGDFKIPRAKKKTISDWCRLNGILWAEGPVMPDSWWSIDSYEKYATLLKEQETK